MTAVTTSTSADQSGRPLSGGVRQASEIRQQLTDLETAGRAVSSTGNQAPATGGHSGRTVVPRPRPVPVSAVVSDGSATTLVATPATMSTHVSAAATAARRDTSGHGEPLSAEAGEAGAELSAGARVEALDGAERKVLLDHIAQAYPDVVHAGFELVARWRAEAAEHRRKKGRQHEHERRRRRRAEEGNRG